MLLITLFSHVELQKQFCWNKTIYLVLLLGAVNGYGNFKSSSASLGTGEEDLSSKLHADRN